MPEPKPVPKPGIDTYTLLADTGGQTVVVISVEEYERLTHIARLADITAAEYDEWREGRER